MARWVTALIATFALLASSAAQSAAESPALSRIVSSRTLRVGMSGTQPPLNFKGKQDQMMGLEVDLARALAGLMRVKLEIVEKPFPKLLGALAAGEVDLVMSGMTTTPERTLKASFVGPYYISGKSILTRSMNLAQTERATDLDQANLKLAALEGSTSAQFAREVLPKASLVTTENYDEAVWMLLSDEVNAVVADREMVALTSFQHPKEGLATLREPLTVEPIGIAVPAGDTQLTNFLENAMGALEASGLLNGIRVRWTERNDWIQHLP